MAKKKYDFMDVPIGANKRFIVTMNGQPFAGFDSDKQASWYIAAQKGKRNHNKGGEAYAANQQWAIRRQW